VGATEVEILISIQSHELQTKYAKSKIHVSHCLTSKIHYWFIHHWS